MIAEAWITGSEEFEPITSSEEKFEGLVSEMAPTMFPGYSYFEFRPEVEGPHGKRHPDGALLSQVSSDWWVVEVELAVHDVESHVGPQLEALASAAYGEKSLNYLKRHSNFSRDQFDIDPWNPCFLLIADHLTSPLVKAAAQFGFESLECTPFRSVHNRYSLATRGFRPDALQSEIPQGIDVWLDEVEGVCLLRPHKGDNVGEIVPEMLLLDGHEYRVRVTRDRQAFVLPISASDLRSLVGGESYFRIAYDSDLIPLDKPGRTS